MGDGATIMGLILAAIGGAVVGVLVDPERVGAVTGIGSDTR